MSGGVDFSLMPFVSYDQYMKSFTNIEDFRYFPSKSSLKKFITIGYRSTLKIYEEDEFHKMKMKIADFLNPKIASRVLYGHYIKSDDPALIALAEREEDNINGKMAVSVPIVQLLE